ncbi:MAG: SsrA-binding protein SmpB [Endomicrobium sp.]|jgi:SsrA-binding protein|nr:SsrA-binding protein SmpB [Endomicrobium sp.]
MLKKKIFSSNKKAYYDYEIIEKFEAGIVLYGFEVKSIKNSNVSIVGGIVKIFNCEAFIYGISIAKYKNMSNHIVNYDDKRVRKILMHKTEINKIFSKTREKGLLVIPLEIYLHNNGKIKILIGIAKFRKKYNKRDYLRKKDIIRDVSKFYRIK